MVVNTYGISVGIAEIGWRLYIVYASLSTASLLTLTKNRRYIVWICVELVTIYFFFVETAGRSLEELSEIFEAKNPRKASTRRVKVGMNAEGDVVAVDGHAA